jgi:hypothetical protein
MLYKNKKFYYLIYETIILAVVAETILATIGYIMLTMLDRPTHELLDLITFGVSTLVGILSPSPIQLTKQQGSINDGDNSTNNTGND